MGLEDPDRVDGGGGDGDGDAGGKVDGFVSCSICRNVVTDNGDRAWAILQCGHQFHLDCIGTEFNKNGAMQCPICSKTEKGQWLFADGSTRPWQESSMDEWTHDEDLHDLSYPETTSMWCPFGGLSRLAASFDEVEFPTSAYHDFLGQHAIIAEHATPVSSLCPYIAYVQPVHPSSSSLASGSVADGSTYNNGNSQWNSSQSATREMPSSFALPNMDVRYHATVFPPSHTRVGGADQHSMPSVMPPRPVRSNAAITRPGSYADPFLLGQTSVAARAPSSVGSSLIPPHPGSAARARERAQALQAYFQQPISIPGLLTPIVSGSRRSSSQVQMGQMGSSSDHTHGGGIYYLPTPGSTTRSGFQEAEGSMPGPFHHTWERDPPPPPHPYPHPHPGVGLGVGQGWGYHQGGGGSSSIFRLQHGSERGPSQGHYRS